jgi:N-formylglutamate amidohydrolase
MGAALSEARLRHTIDAWVGELFAGATALGATLMRARFPRCYIDPNRAPDDIDEAMLDGPWPGGARPGPKVGLGIGLVQRCDPRGAPIYDRRLRVEEIAHRLERCHRPYHRTLVGLLDGAFEAFGGVWHINCHSMKSTSTATSPEGPGVARADFCLGDRDGTTCDPTFTARVAETLRSLGYRVSVNDPYKGVELVRRYSDPRRGRHSLQIEISRALYMDEERVERHAGFERLRADLDRLLAAMTAHVTAHVSERS